MTMQSQRDLAAENERLKQEVAEQKRRAEIAIAFVEHSCETCEWEKEGELYCKEPCPHCDPCCKDNTVGSVYVSGSEWVMRGLQKEAGV